ncbi:MAG: endonuclease/exonuclease/phosphatase family protein [Thermodesulfobacteriota bacterium]
MVDFRVATYNVHKCVGLDRRCDPERVASVIRELNADVIGLQEVDNLSDGAIESAQMDFLARETGYEVIPGPTIKWANGYYGNVLLTRWPVLDKREVDLRFSSREPRGAIEAFLAVYDEEVRVIVTHLGLTFSERWFQIARLVDVIEEKTSPLFILLGDINEWFAPGRGLKLLHRLLGRQSAIRSYPSWRPLFALDRIWVKPNEALKRIWIHKTRLSRVASDHLPVVAEIGKEQNKSR